ncbi:MAG: epoxyqueuosine reductase [Thermoguttaceae bacterium]
MAAIYRDWLRRGCHASMNFLQRGCEPRENPSSILEGVASLVVLAVSYRTVLGDNDDSRFATTDEHVAKNLVADYACGRDYHLWCRERLATLAALHRELLPNERCRGVVDTAPLWEKFWGREAGLGLIGRNTLLAVHGRGSRFFLATLLSTAKFPASTPPADGADNAMCDATCGTCRRCVEACPTSALTENGLDARRCLNYWTIEYRAEQKKSGDDATPIPPEIAERLGNRFFGCDTCQTVCPLNAADNRIRKQRCIPPEIWDSLTPETFAKIYGDTPLGRVSGAQP